VSLVVLKVGGELLEDGAAVRAVADGVARVTAGGTPLVIVHGGGREIDAAVEAAGIEKRQIDGLRITDSATLEIVVSVLAGAVNTRFVAALTTAGVPAVGLTGADGSCGLCDTAGPHRTVDGRLVDLGRVGVPSDRADMRLLAALVSQGFVPVVACIGVGGDGRLLNVNADTLAGHLAARLGARRLVIAGTTSGVLDGSGATLPLVEAQMIPRLLHNGTATAGMIAKLRASERALSAGVGEVVIVDGRDGPALESAAGHGAPPRSTLLVSTVTQGA
jgi:acetylglutamate kinase